MEIRVKSKAPYSMYIDNGAISKLNNLVENKRVFLITEKNVFDLFESKINENLKTAEKIFTLILPNGESKKSEDSVKQILQFFLNENANKNDLVLSFGGGTVSDVVGFSASIFKRGINYVSVPTTLLAIVDASLGGKTAIDYMGIKNLLGTFYSPKFIIADLDFLSSLKKENVLEGLAEIIKCAIIGDKKLFSLLNKDGFNLKEAIFRAIKVKKKIIESDEFELDKRRLLNLGHTFAHAIEKDSNFTVSHGIAVGYGLYLAGKLSENLNLSKDLSIKIKNTLIKNGFKVKESVEKEVIDNFVFDKKANLDVLNFVLPIKIGKCKIVPVKKEELIGKI